MNSHFSLSKIAAVLAATCIASLAFAAAEPAAKSTPPKAKVDTTAASEDKVIRLKPRQPLPKVVKQVTIIDLEPGDKKSETVGKDHAVLVHYTGWLYDPSQPDGKGTLFDTSVKRAAPFGFFIGAGKVIKGWDLGLIGMKVKGKRTLIIPPSLAYGDHERPRIPANSTLIFDVEIFDIVGKRENPAANPTAAAPIVPPPVPTLAMLGAKDPLPLAPMQITAIDQAVGEGAAAEFGNDVLVHYTGWLYDVALPEGKGKKFDSSRDRDQLFRFPLGGGRVIKGWDYGVAGMKVKGKRTLIIPAEFGYGARGAGGGLIPPGATLIFDVELVELPKPVVREAPKSLVTPPPATPAETPPPATK
ncbi:MAG: FKBP-type peptidyl-prolyl cis-trans isomerase [Betaproteobacteria bacterium]